jgi:hypothetical protein
MAMNSTEMTEQEMPPAVAPPQVAPEPGAKSDFAGTWITINDSEGFYQCFKWEIKYYPGDFPLSLNLSLDEMNSGRHADGSASSENNALFYFGPNLDDPEEVVLVGKNILLFTDFRDVALNLGKRNKDKPLVRWYRQGMSEADEYIQANARHLINDWAKAIASGDPKKTEYIEETAEQIRSWPGIVRPLVHLFGQTFPLEEGQKKSTGEETPAGLQQSLEETARVHRRVARLLAEMSDSKYYEEETLRSKVKAELIERAVPVAAARLSTEGDLAIRGYLADMLGKLGEDATTGALVGAVVSDEKARASRQEMLSKYYLEPSREQGKRAATILDGAVTESKRTLLLLQALNVIVFLAGIAILVGGLYMSVTEPSARVEGALVGLGGLAGVITLLVKDPLNRIQNSLSNLVQLESAFTSFIWELNLNSTYIQSQYVYTGRLEEKDITQTLDHIEGAMDFALSQVAAYTEEGREVIVPHLTQLSPVVGQAGETIKIYGSHLRLNGQGKDQPGQIVVAVDHVPRPALEMRLPARKDAVEFILPGDFLGSTPSDRTVWVSLVINGVETNALPLRVRKGRAAATENQDTSQLYYVRASVPAGQDGEAGENRERSKEGGSDA